MLRGVLESVAFMQNPSYKEVATRSLLKNLRLKSVQEAENGYQALQWLYSLDIRPNLKGIQNMHRLLVMTNSKVRGVKSEDVIDEAPVQRMEKTSFYRDLVAHAKR